MTQLAEQTENQLANFARFNEAAASDQPWVNELREQARNQFETLGFPSSKTEMWRFTTFQPIIRSTYNVAAADTGAEARRTREEFSFKDQAVVELVFVNGRFVKEWSTIGKLPYGAWVGSLADAVKEGRPEVKEHLAKYARTDENPFVALNTGFLHEGAYVYIPKKTRVELPIHLLFISIPTGEPTVSHPRVLVVADEHSESTIVESYVGHGEGTYFTNAVTEVVVGPHAIVDHSRLQQETTEAFHLSTTQTFLDTHAQLISHAATIGGRITRNDVNVWMGGEYAEATLNGLVLINGTQFCDNHTLLRHEKANCPSHELYKYVLDDRAAGVFKGKIFVQQDAQKTDSKQNSKILLLSEDATINAQPALEIYADDVKCTHGSTTGPVDEDMVFYLRSRGVSMDAARHLLTYAFAADVTRRMKVEPVRRRLEDFLAAQHGLPQDLRITDLGAHDEAAR